MGKMESRRSAQWPALDAGDKIGEWTLVSLKVNAPAARDRQWLMQCSCGYKVLRNENVIRSKTHSTTCGACTSARTAAKAKESK